VHVWALLTGAAFLLAPSGSLAILGAAFLLAGAPGARVMLLPAAFLLFAVPIPSPLLNEIVWAFQVGTGGVSADILDLFGFPSMARGMVFERPDTVFIVIETCSGLRFCLVFAALGAWLRGGLAPNALHTLAMTFTGVAVGMLLNELRVLAIVLLKLDGSAHAGQGVAVLAGGVALLVGLHRWISRDDASRLPKRTRAPSPEACRAVALLIVVLACMTALVPRARPQRAESYALGSIPESLEGWSAIGLPTEFRLYDRIAFDEVLRRVYTRVDGLPVELFVAGIVRSDSVASPFSKSTYIPGLAWSVVEREVAHGLDRDAEWVLLRDMQNWAYGLSWRLGDLGLVRETLRASLALDASPYRAPRRRAVVRLITPLAGEGPEARAAARSRILAFMGSFAEHLEALE
jgi:exosortase